MHTRTTHKLGEFQATVVYRGSECPLIGGALSPHPKRSIPNKCSLPKTHRFQVPKVEEKDRMYLTGHTSSFFYKSSNNHEM